MQGQGCYVRPGLLCPGLLCRARAVMQGQGCYVGPWLLCRARAAM